MRHAHHPKCLDLRNARNLPKTGETVRNRLHLHNACLNTFITGNRGGRGRGGGARGGRVQGGIIIKLLMITIGWACRMG
jgi:hypothetical protein